MVAAGAGPPPARRPGAVQGVAEDGQQGAEQLPPGAREVEDDLQIVGVGHPPVVDDAVVLDVEDGHHSRQLVHHVDGVPDVHGPPF